MEQSKPDKVSTLVSRIQRNYPDWPATMGPCSEGCGNQARGSGCCPDCLELKLAEVVGGGQAKAFHDVIKARASIVRDMMDSVRVTTVESK